MRFPAVKRASLAKIVSILIYFYGKRESPIVLVSRQLTGSPAVSFITEIA